MIPTSKGFADVDGDYIADAKLDPRYSEPEDIWQAVRSGDVRLLRMTWIIAWADGDGILARRQDLPEEAFISIGELVEIHEAAGSNPDGVLPIISISFCWDTPAHPDPTGAQLRTVAATMRREREKYCAPSSRSQVQFWGFQEMGVFWDWASLYQKDPARWHACCGGETYKPPTARTVEEAAAAAAYEASRNDQEYESFQRALKGTMDLWYAHRGVVVYLLTKLPPGSRRTNGYSASGWTTYERCCAEQIKKLSLLAAKFELLVDLGEEAEHELQALSEPDKGSANVCTASSRKRNWPVAPEDFDELIDSKTFTNGADRASVKMLYRRMSTAIFGGIMELGFHGMPPLDVAQASQLGRCLNLCTNLVQLDLQGVGLNNESCAALFAALAKRALPNLHSLRLDNNHIGDSGLCALAETWTAKSLPMLQLHLKGITASDAAIKTTKDAVEANATTREASGLVWRYVGDAEPIQGSQLSNERLEMALMEKTKFTQSEWNGFAVHLEGGFLRMTHFVRSGDRYFQPVHLDRA